MSYLISVSTKDTVYSVYIFQVESRVCVNVLLLSFTLYLEVSLVYFIILGGVILYVVALEVAHNLLYLSRLHWFQP